MGNLGGLLAQRLEDLGIKKEVEAVGVVEEAEKRIEKIVPKEEFEMISLEEGC